MITPKLLRSWNADARLVQALGAEELSPRELVTREDISINDRLWVIGRTLVHLDERAAGSFAVETALTVARLACDVEDEALFRGLMNDLLATEEPVDARNVAWADVAWDVALDVSRSTAALAAWAAACSAAQAVAWATRRDFARNVVARHVVTNAVCDVVWDAARAVAWAASDGTVAWNVPWNSAWLAEVRLSLSRALEWLGDWADGW
jgi:hypothetical protein